MLSTDFALIILLKLHKSSYEIFSLGKCNFQYSREITPEL
uniref:Uncharacterized protein n=1 Tax=Arundo donax TaxID=35708 RepID=A0A0A9E529_ARUDO